MKDISTARAVWLLVCALFAGVWLLLSFVTFGLALPLVALSLLAMLLPVGKPADPSKYRHNAEEWRKQ